MSAADFSALHHHHSSRPLPNLYHVVSLLPLQMLSTPEIELTLNLLKQGKRFLVTVTFEADHGLGAAIKRVNNIMTLMKGKTAYVSLFRLLSRAKGLRSLCTLPRVLICFKSSLA